MLTLRRFLVLAALCFSFGGFTFYAAVVVPIGSRVLDATMQGFVTQQVTDVLNTATAVTLALVAWEAWAARGARHRVENRLLAGSIAAAAACCVALFALHGQLDALLDARELAVLEHDRFYRLHQIYLWLSVVQWLAFLLMLAVLARPPKRTNATGSAALR